MAFNNRRQAQPFRTIGTVKFFGTLQSARDHLDAFRAPTERIWAQDTRRQNGRGEYVGKTFLVASVKSMYDYIAMRPDGCSVYELISTRDVCRLYLDVEMVPEDGEEFTEDGCRVVINVLREAIRQYIRMAFPGVTAEQAVSDCILQACDSNKFSIHYLHNELFFDNAVCSMYAFVYELHLYVRGHLERQIAATGDAPAMVRRALAVGLIDLSVYRSAQQFRLVGNTKLGKQRPLRVLPADDVVLFPRDRNGVARNSRFVSLCPSMRQFNSLLVSDRAELAELVVSVRPHMFMPMPSVHRAQRELYGEAHEQPDNMNADARQFKPVDDEVGTRPRRAAVGVVRLPNPAKGECGYNMVDDDEIIVLDCRVKVFARDLGDGQGVFCPVCETEIDRTAGRDGKWVVADGVGEASAVTIERESGQIVIYCFNCSVLNVVVQCGDQYGFVAEGDEVVQLDGARKINWRGREDISFDGEYRLYLLDAPMGTGKTHAVREYLRANPALKVISITFRQALARYLSKELDLTCYLDKGFWAPTTDRSRCVICLDSIAKLQVDTERYDLVVIDECVFVQYHFLAGTITTTLPNILATFQQILRNTPRVIAMQHRIPETTIAFYMECMSLPAGCRSIVRRRVNSPVVLHPMQVLTSSNGCRVLEAHLLSCYIKWFSPETNRSEMPIVVFTTRAGHAAILLSMLRREATLRFGEGAANRVRAVWAGVQDDDWTREFLAHPNSKVEDVDVLITTSVLQAGHSLDRYFRVSFDFLFKGVLSFREELQFTSRLRYIGRDNMAEYKFGWIPAGGVDSRRAGQRRIRLDIEQAWDVNASARWGQAFTNTVKSIYIPMTSEMSDTVNRHFWLHKTEYRLSQVRLVIANEDAIVQELEPGITLESVTEYTKDYGLGHDGSISKFMFRLDDEYGEDVEALMDERVDLGDVAVQHMQSVTSTIRSYIRRHRGVTKKESEAVVLNGLKELDGKLPQTPTGVIKKMTPFMNLVALLDLACARRGNDGDDRFWKRRKLSKTFSPSQQQRIALVELCVHVFDSVGVISVDADDPLFPDQVALSADLSREKFYQDFLVPFRGQFAAVRDKTPDAWLAKKVSVKSEIGNWVTRFGLRLKPFGIGLVSSFARKEMLVTLAIVKSLTDDDRFGHWRGLFDDVTWSDIERAFVRLSNAAVE
ncbi:hypothetical protein V1523DRAFT_176431 [Lipomyces doorenjongii]